MKKIKNEPLDAMVTTFWEPKWKSPRPLFGPTWPNLLHLKEEEDVVAGVAEEAEEAAGGVAAAEVAVALVEVTMPITLHLVNVDPDLIDLEAAAVLHVVATILVIAVMTGDMLPIRLVAYYE